MVKKKIEAVMNYGSMIFLVGILITILGGIIMLGENADRIVTSTLILLGIVIGIINIRSDESNSFMLAGISLFIFLLPLIPVPTGNPASPVTGISTLSFLIFQGLNIQNQMFYEVIARISQNILALVIPTLIIVAFKTFIKTAKDE